jgi:hypothetical protein
MADKKYEQSTSNTVSAIGTYIKGKIPKVDGTVTEGSGNAVSSAAVFKYVADEVKKIGGISFKKSDILPETGESGYIYLVPKAAAGTQDSYDEYIWYDDSWEHIGSTDIDISGYVKSSELHEITADEVNTILNAVWGD